MKFLWTTEWFRQLFVYFCDCVIEELAEHEDTLTARKIIRNQQMRVRNV